MSDLVRTLREEHRALVVHLEAAARLGPGSPGAKRELDAVKALVLAHLDREDRVFYKALEQAARTDKEVETALQRFAKDSGEVSRRAIAFFERYEHGGEGIEYARAFGEFLASLRIRLRHEEDVLYPLFEQVLLGKAA